MKRIKLLLIALLMIAGSSMGQTLKTYSGLYEGGKATYTYYEDEIGELVKNGKFTYDTDSREQIHVEGLYNNNTKDARWIYISKNRTSKSTTIINYVNGNMEGTISRTTTFYDGKVEKESFQMKNNRVIGAVKENVFGQFDNDGFPDGTWTKKYIKDGNNFTDTERYVHGLLVAKQTKNESTGEITRKKFEIDPQQFIAAYNPDLDSTAKVGDFICTTKIYIKKPDFITTYLMPEVMGNRIESLFLDGRGRGYDSGQNVYEGIPFKEIVIIDKIDARDDRIFDLVEQMPQYPGGKDASDKYFKENLKYPPLAVQQGIEGRVIVRFIVNRDGSISDVSIARSADASLDKEALRLVENMPKWIPGKQSGKNVRVNFTVPVTFKLPK